MNSLLHLPEKRRLRLQTTRVPSAEVEDETAQVNLPVNPHVLTRSGMSPYTMTMIRADSSNEVATMSINRPSTMIHGTPPDWTPSNLPSQGPITAIQSPETPTRTPSRMTHTRLCHPETLLTLVIGLPWESLPPPIPPTKDSGVLSTCMGGTCSTLDPKLHVRHPEDGTIAPTHHRTIEAIHLAIGEPRQPVEHRQNTDHQTGEGEHRQNTDHQTEEEDLLSDAALLAPVSPMELPPLPWMGGTTVYWRLNLSLTRRTILSCAGMTNTPNGKRISGSPYIHMAYKLS